MWKWRAPFRRKQRQNWAGPSARDTTGGQPMPGAEPREMPAEFPGWIIHHSSPGLSQAKGNTVVSKLGKCWHGSSDSGAGWSLWVPSVRIFCDSTRGNLKSNYKYSDLTEKSDPSGLVYFLHSSAQRRAPKPICPQQTTFIRFCNRCQVLSSLSSLDCDYHLN